MNQLSVRFFITNAITCVWLIFNGATLKAERETMMESSNVPYGLFIYLILILGVYFSWIKAKDLGYRKTNRLNIFEKIFIFLIYLFALIGNSLIAYVATFYLFENPELIPDWFNTVNVIVNLLAVGYIFAEGYVLSDEVNRPPSPNLLRWSNFILPIYSGMAVSLAWNLLILGGDISLDPDRSDFISETIAACVLVLMIIFPYQRLLWYEIFSDSQGWKANVKIVGSLIFVVLCAILPLFF